MRPTMEDKKTSDEVPTFVITSAQNVVSGQSPKQKSKRKYLIIAGSTILVTAIVLAAILVGMYLFTKGQKDILQFSLEHKDGSKEDVSSDPNKNIVQYHVTDKSYEMWVVDDFNKDIQVTKIQTNSDTNCYVAPLNRSIATDPSKISAPADKVVPEPNITLTYRASATTIPDSSFLSKTATDMCKGISTYWIYPVCNSPGSSDDGKMSKRKRGFGVESCCVKYCRWGLCLKLCWC